MSTFFLLGLLADAYRCPNGFEIDFSLDLAFVQDFTSDWADDYEEDWVHRILGRTVLLTDAKFNVDESGNPASDRVTFSFHRANEKQISTNEKCSDDGWCSCNDVLTENGNSQFTKDQLACSEFYSCPLISEFVKRRWLKTSDRADVLDAPLDIAQSYYGVPLDDEETGQRMIRVTAITTDDCARESGRSTTDANLQAHYWSSIADSVQAGWLANPGLNEDGTVTELDCNVRDYPTMDEFMNAMKASSTGLVVMHRDEVNGGKCSVSDKYDSYSMVDYYSSYMGNAAQQRGVPYSNSSYVEGLYEDAMNDFFDSIVKVVEEIACTGEPATTAPENTPDGLLPTTSIPDLTFPSIDVDAGCCCCCCCGDGSGSDDSSGFSSGFFSTGFSSGYSSGSSSGSS